MTPIHFKQFNFLFFFLVFGFIRPTFTGTGMLENISDFLFYSSLFLVLYLFKFHRYMFKNKLLFVVFSLSLLLIPIILSYHLLISPSIQPYPTWSSSAPSTFALIINSGRSFLSAASFVFGFMMFDKFVKSSYLSFAFHQISLKTVSSSMLFILSLNLSFILLQFIGSPLGNLYSSSSMTGQFRFTGISGGHIESSIIPSLALSYTLVFLLFAYRKYNFTSVYHALYSFNIFPSAFAMYLLSFSGIFAFSKAGIFAIVLILVLPLAVPFASFFLNSKSKIRFKIPLFNLFALMLLVLACFLVYHSFSYRFSRDQYLLNSFIDLSRFLLDSEVSTSSFLSRSVTTRLFNWEYFNQMRSLMVLPDQLLGAPNIDFNWLEIGVILHYLRTGLVGVLIFYSSLLLPFVISISLMFSSRSFPLYWNILCTSLLFSVVFLDSFASVSVTPKFLFLFSSLSGCIYRNSISSSAKFGSYD